MNKNVNYSRLPTSFEESEFRENYSTHILKLKELIAKIKTFFTVN